MLLFENQCNDNKKKRNTSGAGSYMDKITIYLNSIVTAVNFLAVCLHCELLCLKLYIILILKKSCKF